MAYGRDEIRQWVTTTTEETLNEVFSPMRSLAETDFDQHPGWAHNPGLDRLHADFRSRIEEILTQGGGFDDVVNAATEAIQSAFEAGMAASRVQSSGTDVR